MLVRGIDVLVAVAVTSRQYRRYIDAITATDALSTSNIRRECDRAGISILIKWLIAARTQITKSPSMLPQSTPAGSDLMRYALSEVKRNLQAAMIPLGDQHPNA
jgi:hypothetical protein